MIVHLGGEAFELLPQRAAYWPARRTLMVADIHFGKAASFRARGIPVPHGTTSDNLAALDTLLALREVEEIVFLGDFLHAKAAHAVTTVSAIARWRAAHAALRLTVVRGNHDAHAGDPPAGLDMRVVEEPHCIGAIACCHHPQAVPGRYVLAGHLHPVFRLVSGSDRIRLPCFMLGPDSGVLPSFGSFTGGMEVLHREGERLFVVTEDAIVEVPAGNRSRTLDSR